MQTKVDRFGRVTIPKTIRDHLELQPGTVLDIEQVDHEIVLKIKDEKLKREHGFLVFTGTTTGDGDIEGALSQIREERFKSVEE